MPCGGDILQTVVSGWLSSRPSPHTMNLSACWLVYPDLRVGTLTYWLQNDMENKNTVRKVDLKRQSLGPNHDKFSIDCYNRIAKNNTRNVYIQNIQPRDA